MSQAHLHLIEALRLFPAILEEFIRDLPEGKLHLRHGEGFWTVHEHLEHMVLTQEVILRRLVLVRDQERPRIVPFDPGAHHRDAAAASAARGVSTLLEKYSGWRRKQLEIIEAAPPELWRKDAVHPEYERYGFEILVRHAVLHDGFHLARIEDLALMKPEHVPRI